MKKIILGIGAIVVLLPVVSFAAYRSAGKNVVLNAAEPINGNAYVAGGNVSISGAVNGDLLTAGGSVFVSGKVARDIMAAGGNVTLSGVSAEDARVAGGNLNIGAVLSGELMAGGGQISVTPDSKIAKDSVIAGGTVTFNGDEAGNLEIYGGSVYVGGTVEKDLTIKGAKDVTIGSSAVIKGNLDYTSVSDAVIENGAQILGTKTFHKSATGAGPNRFGFLVAIFSLWWIAKLCMVLLAAYLLWYLFRNDMVALLTEANSRFGKKLLLGFVFAVAVPVAIIIAFVSVIGTLVGGVAALIYATLLVLGCPVAVLVVASLLKKGKTDLHWYHILLAAVLVQLVMFIPFVGWLARLIVYLVSLGALLAILRRRFAR
jgi:cytoskeletal protein CcmA (bactofilin family)